LQGASLFLSELQGASLDNAQLQGADLDNSKLQGAFLDNAQLQGASLDGANLQGAFLRFIGTWRISNTSNASFEHALLFHQYSVEMSAEEYSNLLESALVGVDHPGTKGSIVERLSMLDPAKPDPKEMPKEDFWLALQTGYDETGHAARLGELACADINPPYVANGMLRTEIGGPYGTITRMPPHHRAAIAKHILAGIANNTCRGALGLDEEAMDRLHEFGAWDPEPIPGE